MRKIPGRKPNYFYSVLSMTLVLFLLGLFGLLALQGRQFVNYLKEKVEIIVELEGSTTPAGLDSLEAFLSECKFSRPNSVQFISKEDGAAMMQEEFGEDFLKLDMANPLYDVITFNVKSEYLEPDSLQEVREEIMQFPFVSDVFYQQTVTNAIAENLNKATFFVLAAGLFFIVVAIALIVSTIRLALYSNRFLIKNMELVGASWGFISKPYLSRSLKHGMASSLIACITLALLLVLLIKNAPEMEETIFYPGIGIIFGSLFMLGVFIPVFSTYYVVNKYLRMRVDDLY